MPNPRSRLIERVSTVVAPFVVVGTLSNPAFAAAPSVRIGQVSLPDSMPTADRGRLETSLRDGLGQAGIEVSEAAHAGALTMRVAQDEADFVVTLEVVDAAGTVTAETRVECELCGVAELSETITASASRLRQRLDLRTDSVAVAVVTQPSQATVLVDGELMGQTPLDTTVSPGDHELVVERRGFRPVATSFTATGGAQSSFDYALRRQPYRVAVPWTLIGTGLLATAGGAALVAIHGNPIQNGCNADVEGNCEFVRRTRPGGAAAIGIGATALISGVVLAILWRRGRVPRRTALRPGGGRL